MKRWRAPRTLQTFVLLALAVLLLAGAGASALQIAPLVRGPVDGWPFGLPMLGFALGTLLLALGAALAVLAVVRRLTLSYTLDRNAIAVVQRGWHYLIPLDHVVAVAPAAALDAGAAPKPLRRFGRGPAAQTVVVETNAVRYQLGVRERDQFVGELEDRRRLGVVQPQREGLVRTATLVPAFLGSPAVRRLLVAAALLNLATWLLLAWRYQLLPDTVPVRFDPIGGTAGTRARSYTLLLPAAATLLALVNAAGALAVIRRSRLAAELLLLGALLVQLVLLTAIWFLVAGT